MDWHQGVALAVTAGIALLLPATGPSASSGALDEGQLRQALLDHMDFSEEWAADSEQAAAERGIGVPVPREGSCRALFETAAKDRATAAFARTFTGPFVTTTAGAHRDEETAAQAVAAFRDATAECGSFQTQEGTPQEEPVTVRYTAGEEGSAVADPPGDEIATARFHREIESEEAPEVVVEAVLVRVGEHTVLVTQAGRDDAETPDIEPLVSRAVAKLTDVAEGRSPEPDSPQRGFEV